MKHPTSPLRGLREDFKINPFPDQRVTLFIWRLGQHAHDRPGAVWFAARRLHGFLDLFWTRFAMGAELPRSVPAGPGLKMPHAGRGVILYPSVRIGSGVTLYHQVTIGILDLDEAPVIGDGVLLGAGARILGNVVVGDGAKIGANAVVLKDVPAGATAVGAPARIIARKPAPDTGTD